MLLILGLGNPGEKYRQTRHNIGFLAIDEWLRSQKIVDPFQEKFNSLFLKLNDTIIIKPQTFMNNSGEAVFKFIQFYKLDPTTDLVVVHDDLDQEFGRIRLRTNGSSGGHNGIESIIEHLNTDSFRRIKIGIGRPAQSSLGSGYVLSPFSKEECEKLPEIYNEAINRLNEIVRLHKK